jgi:hypothetical protein
MGEAARTLDGCCALCTGLNRQTTTDLPGSSKRCASLSPNPLTRSVAEVMQVAEVVARLDGVLGCPHPRACNLPKGRVYPYLLFARPIFRARRICLQKFPREGRADDRTEPTATAP